MIGHTMKYVMKAASAVVSAVAKVVNGLLNYLVVAYVDGAGYAVEEV